MLIHPNTLMEPLNSFHSIRTRRLHTGYKIENQEQIEVLLDRHFRQYHFGGTKLHLACPLDVIDTKEFLKHIYPTALLLA